LFHQPQERVRQGVVLSDQHPGFEDGGLFLAQKGFGCQNNHLAVGDETLQFLPGIGIVRMLHGAAGKLKRLFRQLVQQRGCLVRGHRLVKRLHRYEALIIDDLGYVQQSREEMEVLFTLLSERYERGSLLLSSNLPFSRWEQIFKDPMTTAAAIDRLIHHAVIIELNIPSYRLEAAKQNKNPKPGSPESKHGSGG